MEAELKELKRLRIEHDKLGDKIGRYLKDRFPSIKSIDVDSRWVTINTEYYKFDLWSAGNIDETKKFPTSIPSTLEEMKKMSDDMHKQRQEALTALFYIKFRRER